MRVPIAHALAWPERMESSVPKLDLATIRTLSFIAPDELQFPAIRLAKHALQTGKSAPNILNAANEIAVAHFLQDALGFTDIIRVVEAVLDSMQAIETPSLEAVMAVDAEARRRAEQVIAQII